MEERKITNPLGLAVMAALRVEPSHPYQIAATLKQWHKENSIRINYGSLYTIIASLENAGFIEAKEVQRDGARPEKTIYALTDEGTAELYSWMRELVCLPNKEYPLFGSALSLIAILPPEEVPDLLRERIRQLEKRVAEISVSLEGCEGEGLERLFTIETEYERAMLLAEKEWVSSLLPLITDSPDFTRTWKSWHTDRDSVPTIGIKAGEE